VSQSPRDFTAEVAENRLILPGIVRMEFSAPGFRGLPGQFLELEASPGPFPVTRRPFTINRLLPGGFEILFDIRGRGTELLSSLAPGSPVRTLGPLGNGWRLGPGRWLLIGGGMGVAGFPFLAESLEESPAVLIGASSAERIIPCPGDPRVITEDGSSGLRGRVTDLLAGMEPGDYRVVAVCGPVPMMRAVWFSMTGESRRRMQVSAESRMGCGWGVCGGCAIPSAAGGYVKCCTDGPVFGGNELDWERWTE
jgi:dihydroorotate dehydrogenase electron transfer subunit